MKGKFYTTNNPDIDCHIHVTEKTTRETFKSLLIKHAFPPNSQYTDYYGAIGILHDMLEFFGTERNVDSA